MTRRRGASAVEFAMVLPVVLLLLVGVVDWAWYLFQQAAFVVATTHGARLVSGLAPDEDPAAVAEAEVRAWLDAFAVDGSAATVTVTVTPNDVAGTVHVEATLPHEALFGFAGTPYTMAATADGFYYGDVYSE